MSWAVVTIQTSPGGQVEHCVIVDTATGTSVVLWTATGEPEPLRPAYRLLIQQHRLTDPVAIAEVAFPNPEAVPTLCGREFDSQQQAAYAGARLIAKAHDWKEQDPNVPEGLRAQIVALPDDVRAIRDQVMRAFEQLNKQVEALQQQLTRTIVLPPNSTPPSATSEPQDPRNVIEEYLTTRTADPDKEATAASDGGKRKTRSAAHGRGRDLSELRLGPRIEAVLREHGIQTVSQLGSTSNTIIRNMKGLGPKALEKIAGAIDRASLLPLEAGNHRAQGTVSRAPRGPRIVGHAEPERGEPRAKREPVMGEQAGTVRQWYPDRGYGFISNDQGDRFFVHATEIRTVDKPTLREGQAVEFKGVPHPKGPRAVEVWPGD